PTSSTLLPPTASPRPRPSPLSPSHSALRNPPPSPTRRSSDLNCRRSPVWCAYPRHARVALVTCGWRRTCGRLPQTPSHQASHTSIMLHTSVTQRRFSPSLCKGRHTKRHKRCAPPSPLTAIVTPGVTRTRALTGSSRSSVTAHTHRLARRHTGAGAKWIVHASSHECHRQPIHGVAHRHATVTQSVMPHRHVHTYR